MATREEEPGEIDEFAMFKARSLGVESEYLEMARVGLLRRSTRPRAPLEATKHERHSSYLDQNGTPAAAAASTHLLPSETSNFQRAHSFRAQRRTPGEKRPSAIPQDCLSTGEDNNDDDNNDNETGKFSRQRNLTMPARRQRFDSRASNAGDAENSRSRHRRHATTAGDTDVDDFNHLLVGDRSVLRVRNFTTKDGNIINRGDSIKIRKATARTSGLSSPISAHHEDEGVSRVKVSPRSGSLKGAGHASSAFGARKSVASGLVSCEGHNRPFSSSATHLSNPRANESGSEEEVHRCPTAATARDDNRRLSRRFQSQEEDRPTGGVSGEESQLSVSVSSNLGSRAARHPTRTGREEEEEEEEEGAREGRVEPECRSGGCRSTADDPKRISLHREGRGSQRSLQTEVVKEEEEEEDEEDEAGEVRDETGAGAEEEEGEGGGGGGDDEEQVVYRVVVMGSAGVGKTTLAHQMLTSEYLANNENEIDDDSTDKIVSVQIDGEESLLQLIDQPGQQGAKRKEESVAADANLVVYSVTDRNSYSFAQTCLQDLRPAKRHNVVILVANKQDLVRNRIISEEDGKSLAHKRHCKFIEVSALLSHKVDDLLVGVTRQIRLRKAVGTGSDGGTGSKSADQSEESKIKNSDSDVRIGCLQRAAMDIFRRITRRRRLVESTSCDDLFKP